MNNETNETNERLHGQQQEEHWSHGDYEHSTELVVGQDMSHNNEPATVDPDSPPIAAVTGLEAQGNVMVDDRTTNPETDDEETCLLVQADFYATCRLAARLGAAAMNNGSIAENMERFLPKLMAVYGYYGFFTCSTLQIACNFETTDGDCIVRTQNVPIEPGNFQLTKLGQLSDLAKDLMQGKIDTLEQAHERLEEIVHAPDPWGRGAMALSFVMCGAAIPVLLQGSWWDMVVGPIAGGIAYALILLFDAWPSRVHIWMNLVAAFLCSSLGFACQLVQPQIDPTNVTLSGILILLPSSSITLGINDLATNHVLPGLERLVKGLLILLWQAVGYVLGMSFVSALAPQDTDWVSLAETEVDPIPAVYRLIFVPILCASVAVVFQMTGRDMMGAIVCMLVGYTTSFVGVWALDKPYVSSFMGSIAISTYANIWSRYYDRPNTIILFPAFQLVVAGIVGFMGLTKIIEGSSGSEDGSNQVLHMLLVAGIVVIGFLVGGTVVRPYTTI